jgi:hypothetical protein
MVLRASGRSYEDLASPARSWGTANDNFDIAAEGIQETHQTLHGKALQLIIRERRDFRLIDVQQLGSSALRQFPFLDDEIDGDSQANLGVALFGAIQSQIGKDVA